MGGAVVGLDVGLRVVGLDVGLRVVGLADPGVVGGDVTGGWVHVPRDDT